MKINKKGFTLVELLAVIVIVALLTGIGAISYTAFVNKTKNNVYKTYEDTMKSTTQLYLLDNSDMIPPINGKTILYLNDLLLNNKIDQIKNPHNKEDICSSSNRDNDSYILIERGENIEDNFNLTYNVCLKCSSGYMSDSCSE